MENNGDGTKPNWHVQNLQLKKLANANDVDLSIILEIIMEGQTNKNVRQNLDHFDLKPVHKAITSNQLSK
jgi:hypothetical protein